MEAQIQALMTMLRMYEEKLSEYMTEEERSRFARKVAKKAFREEVDSMEDGEFKTFIIDNIDTIMGEE